MTSVLNKDSSTAFSAEKLGELGQEAAAEAFALYLQKSIPPNSHTQPGQRQHRPGVIVDLLLHRAPPEAFTLKGLESPVLAEFLSQFSNGHTHTHMPFLPLWSAVCVTNFDPVALP